MKRTGNLESCGAHCSGNNLRIKKKEENSHPIQLYSLDCLHSFHFEFKLEGWFRCIKCFLCQGSSSLAKNILISYFQSKYDKVCNKKPVFKKKKNDFILYSSQKFFLIILYRVRYCQILASHYLKTKRESIQGSL